MWLGNVGKANPAKLYCRHLSDLRRGLLNGPAAHAKTGCFLGTADEKLSESPGSTAKTARHLPRVKIVEDRQEAVQRASTSPQRDVRLNLPAVVEKLSPYICEPGLVDRLFLVAHDDASLCHKS